MIQNKRESSKIQQLKKIVEKKQKSTKARTFQIKVQEMNEVLKKWCN